MESQFKAINIEGTEGGVTNGGSKEVITTVANKRKMRGWDFVLRFLALALSLAAAVVLGVNKQTTTVAITLISSLPPINIPVTAKYQYLSAFVYLVVANSVACGYATISLVLSLANRGGNKSIISITIVLFDLAMVALLFSSIGAAGAIGLLALEGNSHVQWKRVCNVFGKFCNHGAAGVGLSGGAAALFFLLVVLATLNLHKKY